MDSGAGYVRWPSHRLTVIVLTNLSNAPYEGLVANIGIQYAGTTRAAKRPVEMVWRLRRSSVQSIRTCQAERFRHPPRPVGH